MKVIQYVTDGNEETLNGILLLNECIGGRTLPSDRVQAFFKWSPDLMESIKQWEGDWRECQVPVTASQSAALGIERTVLQREESAMVEYMEGQYYGG